MRRVRVFVVVVVVLIFCVSIIISLCKVRKNVPGASDKPPVQTTQPLAAIG